MDLKALQKAYKTYSTDSFAEINKQSTDILGLDVVMGGGLPVGRLIEISGGESTSKTLLSLCIASAFQRRGEHIAMVDAERTTTKKDLIRAGIDPDLGTFHYFMPRHGEEALDFVKSMAGTGDVRLILIDSVPYIKPEKSLDKDTGSATMADVARLLGSEQTQLTNVAYDNNCTLLFINQVRAKMTGYGGQETCGGKALKYMYSVRLQSRVQELKKDGSGQTLVLKVLKSKVSKPFQETLVDIEFTNENAVDVYGSFRVELQKLGWIEQKGAYFYLSEEISESLFEKKEKTTLGQGAKKVKEFFQSHPNEYKLLYEMALKELDRQTTSEDFLTD